MYFDTADGVDDPPVYVCQQSEGPPSKAYDTFTDWLNESVAAFIDGCRELKRMRASERLKRLTAMADRQYKLDFCG